jgi:ferritin-like metal-binding protein YciE
MECIDDLKALLKHELNDLYSAEVQLINALPLMASKATNKKLKNAFRVHLKETKVHRKKLLQIQDILQMDKATDDLGFFFNLFKNSEGESHCLAMEGLVKELQHLMKQQMTPEAMDAALIAGAQKVEHYEISSYGSARAFAKKLKLTEVVDLLSDNLKDEYVADTLLTDLAMSEINDEAGVIRLPTLFFRQTANKTARKASSKTAKKRAPRKSTAGSPRKKNGRMDGIKNTKKHV